MDNINKWRAEQAYKRLEDTAIDDIDAAVFSGDMFMSAKNREEFRYMMDRWESKLIQLEQIEAHTLYYKEAHRVILIEAHSTYPIEAHRVMRKRLTRILERGSHVFCI